MHLDTLQALARALVALALVTASLRAMGRASCALTDEGAGRASATLTLTAGAITLGTHVLLSLGAFSLTGSIGLFALIALASRWLPAAPAVTIERPSRVALVGALAFAVIAGWRWVRASVSPSLAPDSMTYHLYRAARWSQLGHDAPEAWPDAAGYYEFFPAGAELFWAHGFALTGDDLCVATVGLALLLACLVAATDLALAWGAGPSRALLAGCAVAATPAALSVSMTGYADAWTLATFLLAATHALLAAKVGRGHGALCLFAAALHLQSKSTGLLAAVIFAAVGLWAMTRDRSLGRKGFALATGLAALLVAPPFLRAWLATGSPLYPLRVLDAWPSSPQLVALLAGRFSPSAAEPSALDVLRAFSVGLSDMDVDPPGWGVAWVIAAPLAAWALARARGRERLLSALTTLVALSSIAALARPEMRELRTAFLPFSPRLFLTIPAVALIYASRLGSPRWDSLWLALVLSGVALSWPLALAPAVSTAVFAAAPWSLGAALLVVACWRSSRSRALLAVSVVLGLSGAFIAARLARARHRGEILAAMGGAPGERAYEVNPVGGAMRVFWRAGDALSRDCARRTAVAFGWAPPGHRIFRYPLLGHGFQNTLSYVPVTRDGSVIDLAAERLLAPRVDPARWYARLRAANVDHVVTSPPHPRELEWMLSRPSLFEPIAPEAAPLGVFRVRAAHRCPR